MINRSSEERRDDEEVEVGDIDRGGGRCKNEEEEATRTADEDEDEDGAVELMRMMIETHL